VRRTRVAVIGGLSRANDLWVRIGARYGLELEQHDGNIHGRGSLEVTSMVRRADIVIIITDPNSHGGVETARRVAIAAGRPHVLVDRLRPHGLPAILAMARGRHPAHLAVQERS